MIFAKHLFNALTSEDTDQFKKNSISRYGRLNVQRAESFINKLNSDFLKKLKNSHDKIVQELYQLHHLASDSLLVQELIEKHFNCIKQYWGTIGNAKQHLESYNDLALKYSNDIRFAIINDESQPEFAQFMHEAMSTFIKKNIKRT